MYGIHDLSRTELDNSTKLPRFNMPLELGIFLGACYLGDKRQQRKKCLIFDREQYRYQKYISDVAGQDITPHKNDQRTLVGCVRDWLANISDPKLPGGSEIWDRYLRFKAEVVGNCREDRRRPEELTFSDYVCYVDAFRITKDDELITKDKPNITNPTPTQIRQALRDLSDSEENFVIYAKSGSGLTYMQTAGSAEEGFILEHQSGSLEAHFVSANQALSLADIEQVFLWYAERDGRWQANVIWEQLEL